MKNGKTGGASVLAVDVGKTACRAALWRSERDEPLVTAEGEGSFGLAMPDGVAVTEASILAVAKPLLERGGIRTKVDAVGVGVPGALTYSSAAHRLAERLLESLPSRTVAVASDAVTSHIGALGGSAGVVLAAGTGAVVLAIGPERQFHRVDGWGPWLGDTGSGAWLGREGLRAVARAEDGRGPATVLQQSAVAQYGDLEQLALKLGADENPARTVAAFVPAIARAAEENDAVALGLIHSAAEELAFSITAGAAALEGLTHVPVAMLGGLVEIGPALMDMVYNKLEETALPLRIVSVQGTSLDGAYKIATQKLLIHDPWIAGAGTFARPSLGAQSALQQTGLS